MNDIKIVGRVTVVLPEVGGVSMAGKQWRRQDVVILTEGKYPKSICFSLMNERIDKYKVDIGQRVEVSINIESREHNGRWFTSCDAWQVAIIPEVAPRATPPYQQYQPTNEVPQPPQWPDKNSASDLPF